MRTQDYAPPKLTLGVVGIVAIIIPILLGYFLVSGLATSSSYSCAFSCATSTTTATSSTGAVAVTSISIPNGAAAPAGAPGYAPASVTVVIGVNSTVTWTNNDIAAHTVTADNTTGGTAVFDSGNLPAGQAFTYNFTTPGTYTYHCDYHAWMKGTVIVKAGGPSVTTVAVSIPNGAAAPAGAPGYAPDTIILVMGVNNSVTWTNNDIAAHTVTSDNTTGGTPVFDSGNMAAGASYSYTFTAPGTYTYHCDYHAWMKGTVVVKAGAAPPAAGPRVSIPTGAGNPSGAPGYAPDKITVVIGVNNTVTFVNNDGSVHHTVTSTSVPSGAASFNSGDMAGGATFTYTFTVPGTYQYDCVYHPWMTGTVTVVAGP